MRKLLFLMMLLGSPALAKAELTNSQICDMAHISQRLSEVTFSQCTCAMGKADIHLDADMKLALVEAMVAGTSPIHAMLGRGYKMNVIAKHLEAYGKDTGAKCGIPNLF